jgi:hypothetical protein|tara:strand:- start:366 stop:608 length:243 start_codon:yes stop_codon:yes gene_type:complete
MLKDKIIKLNPEEYIAYTSEWADDLMQIKYGKEYERYVTYNRDGNSSYTEEGQEIFEDILASVEQCMADLDIINKELNDV